MDMMSDGTLQVWLQQAYTLASDASDDLSNQNAAIILIGDEHNRRFVAAPNALPHGVEKTDERIKVRPTKYAYIEHAERNAIYRAARAGLRTEGAIMVCPWFACADCARAIVQAGIKQVYGHRQRMEMTNVGREKVVDTVNDRWVAPVSDGDIILREAGVETFYYDGPMTVNILINEQRITQL